MRYSIGSSSKPRDDSEWGIRPRAKRVLEEVSEGYMSRVNLPDGSVLIFKPFLVKGDAMVTRCVVNVVGPQSSNPKSIGSLRFVPEFVQEMIQYAFSLAEDAGGFENFLAGLKRCFESGQIFDRACWWQANRTLQKLSSNGADYIPLGHGFLWFQINPQDNRWCDVSYGETRISVFSEPQVIFEFIQQMRRIEEEIMNECSGETDPTKRMNHFDMGIQGRLGSM